MFKKVIKMLKDEKYSKILSIIDDEIDFYDGLATSYIKLAEIIKDEDFKQYHIDKWLEYCVVHGALIDLKHRIIKEMGPD